jgi:hypothetical protein
MARRIQPIFDAILADSRLSSRDRDFVTSLQTFYKRKKMLTQGRRRALLVIEEKLKAPIKAIDPETEKLIKKVSDRAYHDRNDWAVAFVADMRARLLRGASLSAKQKQAFDNLVKRYNDDAQVEELAWAEEFNTNHRLKFDYFVNYYRNLGERTGETYYSATIRMSQSSSDYVPSKGWWKKTCEKPKTKALFLIMDSEPKFKAGSYVTLRNSARSSAYGRSRGILAGCGDWETKSLNAEILDYPDYPPFSAVKGGKLVRILFFGVSRPTLTEERHLKKVTFKGI